MAAAAAAAVVTCGVRVYDVYVWFMVVCVGPLVLSLSFPFFSPFSPLLFPSPLLPFSRAVRTGLRPVRTTIFRREAVSQNFPPYLREEGGGHSKFHPTYYNP